MRSTQSQLLALATCAAMLLSQGCYDDTNIDVSSVICPFLATMIKEGALPQRDVYTLVELRELTINAGIDNTSATIHADMVNFRDVPTGMMDVFDMEGNINEHVSSTGVTDCETSYPESGTGNCTFDSITGNNKCPTPNTACQNLRSGASFDTFFSAADTDSDGMISFTELDQVNLLYDDENVAPASIDFNRGTQRTPEAMAPGGALNGAFRLLLTVFGEECNMISRDSLETVLIMNAFPPSYAFPSSRVCGDPFAGLGGGER